MLFSFFSFFPRPIPASPPRCVNPGCPFPAAPPAPGPACHRSFEGRGRSPPPLSDTSFPCGDTEDGDDSPPRPRPPEGGCCGDALPLLPQDDSPALPQWLFPALQAERRGLDPLPITTTVPAPRLGSPQTAVAAPRLTGTPVATCWERCLEF